MPSSSSSTSSVSSSEAAPGRSLRVRWACSRYRSGDVNVVDGIRIRFDALEAVDRPTKVFAYQLLPMVPATQTRAGAFDHVCSPVDLEDYPEDEPIPGARPEWFRLDYVDVLVRSRHEADAYIADILADLRALKATLDLMDTLEPGDEVLIE